MFEVIPDLVPGIPSTADVGASQTVDPGDKLRDDALKDYDGDRPAKKNMDALIQHDLIFSGVPEGLDALVLSRLTREAAAASGGPGYVLHVARDDRRLESLRAALAFFDPKVRGVYIARSTNVRLSDSLISETPGKARMLAAATLSGACTISPSVSSR